MLPAFVPNACICHMSVDFHTSYTSILLGRRSFQRYCQALSSSKAAASSFWTCLFLQRCMQKYKEVKWASAGLALLIAATVCWYGVKIAWGVLGLLWSLSCFTLCGSASTSLWIMHRLLWRPNFMTSLLFALSLRELLPSVDPEQPLACSVVCLHDRKCGNALDNFWHVLRLTVQTHCMH